MAGIRMAGLAEGLLLEGAVAASPAAEDLSAAAALQEAGECEKSIHARGAKSHRCCDRRDRTKHCGGSARRSDARLRSLFSLSGCMGCHRRASARRARKSAPARYREPHHDHDRTVDPDCDDAATRMASDPALDRTEARQARSRLATRASRIQ